MPSETELLMMEIRDARNATLAGSLWHSPAVSGDRMSRMIGLAPSTLENTAREGRITAFHHLDRHRGLTVRQEVRALTPSAWAGQGCVTRPPRDLKCLHVGLNPIETKCLFCLIRPVHAGNVRRDAVLKLLPTIPRS